MTGSQGWGDTLVCGALHLVWLYGFIAAGVSAETWRAKGLVLRGHIALHGPPLEAGGLRPVKGWLASSFPGLLEHRVCSASRSTLPFLCAHPCPCFLLTRALLLVIRAPSEDRTLTSSKYRHSLQSWGLGRHHVEGP